MKDKKPLPCINFGDNVTIQWDAPVTNGLNRIIDRHLSDNVTRKLCDAVEPFQGCQELMRLHSLPLCAASIDATLLKLRRLKNMEEGFGRLREYLVHCERLLLGTAVRDEAELRELLTQIREIREGVVKAGEHLSKL